jgi:protein-disulfide isomerase
MKQLLHGRNAVFAAVGIAALGIAVGLIVASVVGSSDKKTTATATVATSTSTSTEDTGVPLNGVAETTKLLAGIPQHGNVLGKPDAPVTMIEFADLQCPYCAQYALDALPTIVRDYVRTGKVKLVFNGMAFIGPDSEKALRAAYAAALQDRLWNVVDLLYKNQGAENSGWVTDGVLESVARSIPGIDVNTMLDAQKTTAVDEALAKASAQAQQANVTSTPSFFAGPTGSTLQPVQVTKLTPEPFQQALDALLR